jgi:hypothetical protein
MKKLIVLLALLIASSCASKSDLCYVKKEQKEKEFKDFKIKGYEKTYNRN